jgi:hypothetical protein
MMKCPKCHYERQSKDNQYVPATECPACGIVYAKSGPASQSDGSRPVVSLIKKPSPVDEISLKKARERVEMRLRKQLETKVRDERHAQTLERARMIASLEVEKKKTEKSARDEAGSLAEPVLDLVDVDETHRQVKAMASSDQADQTDSNDPAFMDSSIDVKDATNRQPVPETDPIEADCAETASEESTFVSGEETTSAQDNITHLDKPSSDQSESTSPGDVDDEDQQPVSDALTSRRTPIYPRQQCVAGPVGFGRLLPAVAWLILVAGIIGAVLSWTTLKEVQAGIHLATPPGLSSLPLGLLLGFAYLATGVLGFAFFWVSSLISRQLKDIRRLLLTYPIPMREDID